MKEQLETIFKTLEHLHLGAAFEYTQKIIDINEHQALQALYIRYQQAEHRFYILQDIDANTFLETEKEIAEAFVHTLHRLHADIIAPKVSNLKSHIAPLASFTGRTQLLDSIESELKKGDNQIAVLYGVDGMGKSRVAAEYAYRLWDQGIYRKALWWINASNPATLENDLEALAGRLTLPSDSGGTKIEQLVHWLDTNANWLLIFDDANDLSRLKTVTAKCRGHVIITTANQQPDNTIPGAVWIQITALNDSDAAKLLSFHSRNRLSSEEIADYVQHCGGYPLLLEVIGAFHGEGVGRKKQLAGGEFNAFLRQETDPTKKLLAVIGSIREQLKVFNPRPFYDYISLGITLWALGSFDGQKIPKSLLSELLREFTSYREEKRFNAEGANWWHKLVARFFNWYQKSLSKSQERLLDILLKRSFIHETDPEHLSVHHFMQLQFLDIAFRTDRWIMRNGIVQYIDLLCEVFYFNANNLERVQKCRAMLPHVASVLKRCQQAEFFHESVLKLTTSLIELLIYEERYLTAKDYADYAFEVNEKTGNKYLQACLTMRSLLSFIIGERIENVDQLMALPNNVKNNTHFSAFFIKGLESISSDNSEEALQYFETAIEKTKHSADLEGQLHILYGLAAASAAERAESKCDSYCEKAIFYAIEEYGEQSIELARVYILVGDTHKNRALRQQDDELKYSFFQKAIEWYDSSLSILEINEKESSVTALTIIHSKMLCWYWLDDLEATETCLNRLEDSVPFLRESLGADHSILSDIERMRSMIP